MEQMEKERLHKEKLLDMVREKALELGKIPHPRDLPEVCREIISIIFIQIQYLIIAAIETVKMIINKLKKRDGLHIDNEAESLQHAAADGFRKLVIQPLDYYFSFYFSPRSIPLA